MFAIIYLSQKSLHIHNEKDDKHEQYRFIIQEADNEINKQYKERRLPKRDFQVLEQK